jgi:hypothetical protein
MKQYAEATCQSDARRNQVVIAYYRVSTDRQGKSGLGLEAHKKAIAD